MTIRAEGVKLAVDEGWIRSIVRNELVESDGKVIKADDNRKMRGSPLTKEVYRLDADWNHSVYPWLKEKIDEGYDLEIKIEVFDPDGIRINAR